MKYASVAIGRPNGSICVANISSFANISRLWLTSSCVVLIPNRPDSFRRGTQRQEVIPEHVGAEPEHAAEVPRVLYHDS